MYSVSSFGSRCPFFCWSRTWKKKKDLSPYILMDHIYRHVDHIYIMVIIEYEELAYLKRLKQRVLGYGAEPTQTHTVWSWESLTQHLVSLLHDAVFWSYLFSISILLIVGRNLSKQMNPLGSSTFSNRMWSLFNILCMLWLSKQYETNCQHD